MNNLDLLKKLREQSGAGMLDCKKALDESDNDYQLAVDLLRKKGIASAQKKLDREIKEGVVSFKSNDKYLAICEINCETDFVARSDKFQEILKFSLDAILSYDVKNLSDLRGLKLNGDTFENLFTVQISSLGENIQISRILRIDIQNLSFSPYIHNALENNSNAGRILSITFLNKKIPNFNSSSLLEDIKKISMHIAATRPIALQDSDVNPSVLEKEKEIFSEQARASGKPNNVIQKMIEGRLKKFLQENVLLQQQFVMNQDITVSQFFEETLKSNSISNIEISSFVRWQLGE